MIRFGEAVGWKVRVPEESWLPPVEVRSILGQCDFDIVKQQDGILLPMWVPVFWVAL